MVGVPGARLRSGHLGALAVALQEVLMSRVQLAINVAEVDEAVAFFTKRFGTGPAKRRPCAEGRALVGEPTAGG